MKKSALALFLIGILVGISQVSLAQNGMEDVIYLKDGSIYRGVLIEQVPNESYKIRSKDGNVYAVTVDEVEKITKEDIPWNRQRSGKRGWGMAPWGRSWNDSTSFEPKSRGYFNELQVLIENVQGGLRFVNGYKFGRYGYLGIGVGFDRVFSSPINPRLNGLEKKELEGVYLPLYVFHAGDGPSKGRVTPFYAIEAGYAMAWRGWDNQLEADDFGNRLKGGPMAGFGLGFKFHPKRHRGHFSLLFNINYKRVNFDKYVPFLDNNGTVTGVTYVESTADLFFPGIRLGIGF